MRQLPVRMNEPASRENTYECMLKQAFADIEANLLTSEAKCLRFMTDYTNLTKDQKKDFLCKLAMEYGFEKDSVLAAANSITTSQEQSDAAGLLTAAERIRSALQPKFRTLFCHIGRINGGVKFLVDLRADVLTFKLGTHKEIYYALYQELNSITRDLLMLWFTVGYLNLERITWNSPCDVVQKVSNYEVLHRIKTWDDMKRRVGPYRRCYIFIHHSMPREPVVVLHCALTTEISSSIHSIIQNSSCRQSHSSPDGGEGYPDFSTPLVSPLTPSFPLSPTALVPHLTPTSLSTASSSVSSAFLDEDKEDPSQINCAVFYSITSTQKGLQGIDMGNYLIRSVVRKVQEEFPYLTEFSSLSPIPGFRDWLLNTVTHYITMRKAGEDPGVPVLLPDEAATLAPYQKPNQQNSPLEVFKEQISTHNWYRDPALTHVMKGPLLRLCAHYLYVQKRRGYAMNPVANFHLSNGAVLWRINFLADTSQRGFQHSCSLMVNYRYFLNTTEINSQNYLEKHQIQASTVVLDILRGHQSNGSG